jgi:alpha-glucosidase
MAGPQIMTLQKQSPELKLFVVPGQCDSSTQVYEDDGESQAYDTEYAVTKITKTIDGNFMTLKVAPREGSFKGMLDNRRISVVLDGFCIPANIKVNGKRIPYSRFASYEQETAEAIWGYDGNDFQTTLWLSETPANEELEIVISFEGLESSKLPNGMKGLVGRIMKMTPEAKYCFAALKIKDLQLPSEFLNVAQCGSYVTEDPVNFDKYLRMMDVKAMIDNINNWEKLSPEFKIKVKAQTEFKK